MSYNNKRYTKSLIFIYISDLDQFSSPIGLPVVVLANSQVQLTWSPPSDHSICITKYTIRAISDTAGDKTANTN